MHFVVCLTLFVAGAFGENIIDGICNIASIDYVTDLNVTQMLGTWNQIARIDNSLEQGDCSILTLQSEHDANETLTGVLGFHSEVINKTTSFYNGSIIDPVQNNLFYIQSSSELIGPFVVLATNYKDYAVVYHCMTISTADATLNTTDTKLVLAWQLHRKGEVTEAEHQTVMNISNKYADLNETDWKFISHNNTACGRNAAVSLTVPRFLVILAALFIGKGFI